MLVVRRSRRRMGAMMARRRTAFAGEFGAMLILLVLWEEGFPQVDGSQNATDRGGGNDGHVHHGLKHNPRLAGGNAGLIGEVLGGLLHLSQRRRSRRLADAVRPAHVRAFPAWSSG